MGGGPTGVERGGGGRIQLSTPGRSRTLQPLLVPTNPRARHGASTGPEGNTVTSGNVTVYRTSDGRYFTRDELAASLDGGTWTLCLCDRDRDRWLVEDSSGQLLSLVPLSPADCPPWVEVRSDGVWRHAVDVRRTHPRPDRPCRRNNSCGETGKPSRGPGRTP